MSYIGTLDFFSLVGKPFLVTIAALFALSHLAPRFGLVDRPCSRKQHQGSVPLIGGLAIYVCILFVTLSNSASALEMPGFIAAVTLITLTGLADDLKNINFKIRIGAEIVATLVMIKWGNIQIHSLGNLFGFGEIQLGAFSTAFTVFAVVGGINAFNMIDGIDGLAGGTSLLVYLMLSGLCVYFDCSHSIQFCLLLSASTLAFLAFNFPIPGRKKAWAFLGDTGSKLFGFTICWLVISASQTDAPMIPPVAALWLIAIPIIDSVCIIIRRLKKGRSPFDPDREHLHHILIVAGYSKQTVLLVILVFSTLTGLTGVIATVWIKVPDWIMFYAFLVLFSFYYWCMNHSWKMVKVARFLRSRKNGRRKSSNRRTLVMSNLPFEDRRSGKDRRSGRDRRYQASRRDLRFFQETQSSYGQPVVLRHRIVKSALNFLLKLA